MKQNSLTLTILFAVNRSDSKKYSNMIDKKYNIRIVNSVQSMRTVLNTQTPDLIVLDDDLILTILDEGVIKTSTADRMLPVIILVKQHRNAVDRLPLGITDYFLKPVIPELFLHRIRMYMNFAQDLKLSNIMNIKIHDQLKQKSEELIKMQSGIIGVLSEAIEFRDFETESHNTRTQTYIEIIIRKMMEVPNKHQIQISLWDINDHVMSSQLHDIGKIGIPDEVLLKKDPLTPEEFKRIQEHVDIGVRIIDKTLARSGKNVYLDIARKYIISHHERWDGKGYPNKLAGNKIPLEGRILSVVDVYDALTSARPYKSAETHMKAVMMINAGSGTQFDPDVVRIFNMVESEFKDRLK